MSKPLTAIRIITIFAQDTQADMRATPGTMAAILIIEDDQSLLETLELLLRRHGHHVLTATSGCAGLQLFARNKPELIFLDIGLPDQSGIEVLGHIRQQGPVFKVIVITAFRQLDVYEQAGRLGVWGYLFKPLDAHQILQAVETALAVHAPLDSLVGSRKRNTHTL